jgi:hypothetical protein
VLLCSVSPAVAFGVRCRSTKEALEVEDNGRSTIATPSRPVADLEGGGGGALSSASKGSDSALDGAPLPRGPVRRAWVSIMDRIRAAAFLLVRHSEWSRRRRSSLRTTPVVQGSRSSLRTTR